MSIAVRQEADLSPDVLPELDGTDFAAIDPVGQYLQEIGRFPLLNAAQEVALARALEAGEFAGEILQSIADDDDSSLLELAERHGVLDDQLPQLKRELGLLADEGSQARECLINSNLRLVVSIAKKYTHRGMPLLDLIQEGNDGLIHAVEKFDYQKGYKFSTYATWWIKQRINRAMPEQSQTIRLPIEMFREVDRMNRTIERLTKELGRHPEDEELRRALEWTPEKLANVQEARKTMVSLNSRAGDGDSELGDLLVDEGPSEVDYIVRTDLSDRIRGRLNELLTDVRERDIMLRRFGLGPSGEVETLEAIGKTWGVGRERIRQLVGEVHPRLANDKVLLELLNEYKDAD